MIEIVFDRPSMRSESATSDFSVPNCQMSRPRAVRKVAVVSRPTARLAPSKTDESTTTTRPTVRAITGESAA